MPVETMARSQLRELNRFGPNVDLVCDEPSVEVEQERNVVVKYHFLFYFSDRLWRELNICMRLPAHPNIVPFDRPVIVEGKVIGFTNLFIPGRTIEQNNTRTFRLRWLAPLITTVDNLNLNYIIMHQDIAPPNLLVDPDTEDILLFDFNWSARIGIAVHLKSGTISKASVLRCMR
jgi:hypothetical protein